MEYLGSTLLSGSQPSSWKRLGWTYLPGSLQWQSIGFDYSCMQITLPLIIAPNFSLKRKKKLMSINIYWRKYITCVRWFLSTETILQQYLQLSVEDELKTENPPTNTHLNLHFLTYWICQFKVYSALCQVSPLVKSHLLINTTQWFSALFLECYMILNHMPQRTHPWRTWNPLVHAFLYACTLTKEAWTWALRWESSRGLT